MKNKRIVSALLLAGIMSLVVACEGPKEAMDKVENKINETTSEVEESVEKAGKDFELLDIIKTDATIEETVVYDQNDLKITAKKLSFTDRDVVVEFEMENNTDKTMNFASSTSGYPLNAINGFMIEDGYTSTDVEPGKTETVEMSFGIMNLQLYGITEIAEIQVGFSMQDENYDNDCYTGAISLKTSAADSYDPSTESSNYHKVMTGEAIEYAYDITVNHFSDEKIYESNDISVVSTCLATNKDDERALFVEIRNDSDRSINCRLDNLVVNGNEVSEGYLASAYTTPGKSALLNIPFDRGNVDEETWESLGLRDAASLETIGVSISAKDDNYTDVATPADLVINVK